MPSVLRLSMGSQIARPATCAGKPAMTSTDLAIWRLGELAIFTENLAFFSVNLDAGGAQMYPAIAEAATTAGEPRYALASRSPMRPLKLRLVALMPTSPALSVPIPRPMQ